MAEIMEFLENPGGESKGKKKKKLNKKQIFYIACGVVAVVALFVWWRNRNKSSGTVEYVASGYGGYPVVPESESSDINDIMASYEESLVDTENFYNSLLTEQEQKYNQLYESTESRFGDLYNQHESFVTDANNTINTLQSNLSYAEIVSQMRYNSDAYYYTSGADRQALVEQNEALGASIGATKNEAGQWFAEDGTRLFVNAHEASAQNLSTSTRTVDDNTDYSQVIKNLTSQGKAGNSQEVVQATINRATKITNNNMTQYATTYDKNVDYQAAINEAKASGASQSVIDTLTAQRNAKIKGENLNADGSKK